MTLLLGIRLLLEHIISTVPPCIETRVFIVLRYRNIDISDIRDDPYKENNINNNT